MVLDRQQHGRLPCREIRDDLDERRREEQQALHRYVLAERHEVHLAVDAAGRAVGAHQIGRVVVPGRDAALDLVAPEQYRHACVPGDSADRIGGRALPLEDERRRGFGPDDEAGPLGNGLTGHPQITLEDVGGPARIPLLSLLDIALNERNAERGSAAGQITARDAIAPPGGEAEDEKEYTGERDGPPEGGPCSTASRVVASRVVV